MTGLLPWLLVALGGGAGAAARYVLAGAIDARRTTAMPVGTMAVNALGSFLIGVIAGLVMTVGADGSLEGWRLLLAVGLCGGFTTFSTATMDSVILARHGRWLLSIASVGITVVVCVSATALGIAATTAVVQ
jgi:CrcB protein